MERIVSLPDGQCLLLEGKVLDDSWDVYVRNINGHREISFKNAVSWREIGEVPPSDSWDTALGMFAGDPERLARLTAARDAEAEERRQANLERAARRAKKACRLAIKAWGLNELLTLTYRDNQRDRDLCKKHFKEWVRRMKKALGLFQYVAAFEVQKRGAMHVHVATHKLPKNVNYKGVKIPAWRLGTAVWRSIVGSDNGLCFVGGKSGSRRKNRSVAKLAAYVSKYIIKDYHEAPEESNRYSRSDGFTCPKAERIRLAGVSLRELLPLVFECNDGEVIVSHRLTIDKWSGVRYWLVTEPIT